MKQNKVIDLSFQSRARQEAVFRVDHSLTVAALIPRITVSKTKSKPRVPVLDHGSLAKFSIETIHMGQIRQVSPVLLFIAAFAPTGAALGWARQRAELTFGPIELESDPFRFDRFTDYYAKSMGDVLFKRLWGFRQPIDPATLPDIKRLTNDWEAEYAATASESVSRPLNLDPGYVDLGKLILASTKDHAHRIYLRDGIFAETTLIFTKKLWTALPWTYPDYQSSEYHEFLSRCREFLRETNSSAPQRVAGRRG